MMALQAAPAMLSMTSSTSSQVFCSPSSSVRFVVVRVPNLTSSFLGRGVIKIAHPNRTTRCIGHGGGGATGSQMNIFERFAMIIRSYANAFLGSFEDPQKILEQAVLEMSDDLAKMRQATTEVLASQKLLRNKYKADEKAAADWYQRTKLALTNGKEDYAREALKRHKSHQESATSLKTQLDQQKTIVDNLVSNTRLLESKIQEAQTKKQILKTATKVSGLLGTVTTSSALAAFEKIEEKVLTMEFQVEALNQLTNDDLARKFALFETSSALDVDLANLKKEVSGSLKKKREQLPPARTAVRRLKAIPVPETEC